MDPADVRLCDFSRWSKEFEDVLWPFVCMRIPPEFLDYLREDGVRVRDGSRALPKRDADGWSSSDEWTDEDEDSDETKQGMKKTEGEGISECSSDEEKILSFGSRVDGAIAFLGGSVLPRLNWSCPSDATWVSLEGNMRCKNADEVFLLLKCSSRISYDLGEWKGMCSGTDHCPAHDGMDELHLILRKWVDLRHRMEFRVFVRQHVIVGMSQRDPTLFHEFSKQEKDKVKKRIHEFYESRVLNRFGCADFVLDVYLEGRNKVYIVDFNTFGGATQPLLFSWEELTGGRILGELRVVESGEMIQPSPKICLGVPTDLVDTSDSSALADFLRRVQVEQPES